MKPNWYGIAGWLCLALAFVLAAFVIPFPLNGWALATVLLGIVGGLLIALAVRRRPGDQR